jgi:hypothetical protein
MPEGKTCFSFTFTHSGIMTNPLPPYPTVYPCQSIEIEVWTVKEWEVGGTTVITGFLTIIKKGPPGQGSSVLWQHTLKLQVTKP